MIAVYKRPLNILVGRAVVIYMSIRITDNQEHVNQVRNPDCHPASDARIRTH